MKVLTLNLFLIFFSLCAYGQHSQINSAKELYELTSIVEIQIVTIDYDTSWYPGDSLDMILEQDWYRGDSINFVKFYPYTSQNDTSKLSVNELASFQFEYLVHYSQGNSTSFRTNTDLVYVEFTFDASNKLTSEFIKLESISSLSEASMSYSLHRIEYEYSGPFLIRKKYFDVDSLSPESESKLIKILEFHYTN